MGIKWHLPSKQTLLALVQLSVVMPTVPTVVMTMDNQRHFSVGATNGANGRYDYG